MTAHPPPRPARMRQAVVGIRREFVGGPLPVRVSLGVGSRKRWPPNAHPVRGREATTWFDVHTGAETDFGVLPR